MANPLRIVNDTKVPGGWVYDYLRKECFDLSTFLRKKIIHYFKSVTWFFHDKYIEIDAKHYKFR